MTLTTADRTLQASRGLGTLGIIVGISALIFGVLLLITGIVRIFGGIASRELDGGQRALSITLGVLILLAGIFCLRNPGLTLLWIVILVACGWLIDGIIQVVHGLRRDSGCAYGPSLSVRCRSSQQS